MLWHKNEALNTVVVGVVVSVVVVVGDVVWVVVVVGVVV